MKNLFNRYLPFTNKMHKNLKSRLGKDGFILSDAIIAFTIITVLVVLVAGFIGTKVRTTATITNDAEDHQASMTAMAQALKETTLQDNVEFYLTGYVPSRSLTHPNQIHIFNNYDYDTNKLREISGETYELLSKNIITSSQMSLTGHGMQNYFYHYVSTSKFLGAKFSFKPVSNLNVVKDIPTAQGYYNIIRAPKFNSLPLGKTLNQPVDYNAVEVLNYENHSN